MGEKESASQSLEGKFDTRGLKALMNGGESDDILAALSKGMQRQNDPIKVWKEVDEIENPFKKKELQKSMEELPLLQLAENDTSSQERCSTSSTTTELPLFELAYAG